MVQEDVLKPFVKSDKTTFSLICKWGCDGSSGHNQYKQPFSEEGSDDEYMFVVSFVPICLYAEYDDSSETKIVWQNPKCSSTKYLDQ